MKKINVKIFFLLLFVQVLSAWGGPVDVDRARAYAISSGLLPEVTRKARTLAHDGKRGARAERLLRLAYTLPAQDNQQEPLLYIFTPTTGKGYIVIAGDDTVEPTLGYSPESTFDADDMPPQLLAFLRLLGSHVEQAADKPHRARAAKPTVARPEIAPLLGNIAWGQDAPFNTLTPMTQGYQCPTGCVATALSQVLYYHRHPARATGEVLYKFSNVFTPGKFVKLGEHGDFQWDKMRPNYPLSEPPTQEEREAVGRLLFEIGAACNMIYGPTESSSFGINALQALHKNLGYPSARIARRMNMSATEWDNLIYSELAAQRPVYLDGSAAEMGHAFICDGYDSNGLYHINWGWEGKANGYFKLTYLSPTLRGTGGSGRGGFVVDLQAIVNIAPPASSSTVPSFGMLAKALTKHPMYANEYPKFIIKGVRLEGYETVEVDFSLGVRQADGSLLNVGQSSAFEIRKLFTYNNVDVLLRPDLLPEGRHRLLPIYSLRGKNEWKPINVGRYFAGSIEASKINGVFSIQEETDNIQLEVSTEKTFLLSGADNELRFRIKNTGRSAYSSFVSALFSNDALSPGQTVSEALVKKRMVAIHLEPGETQDFTTTYRPDATATSTQVYLTFDPTNGLSEKEIIVPATILSHHQLSVKDRSLYNGSVTARFDSTSYTVHRFSPWNIVAKTFAATTGTQQGSFAQLQCFICATDNGGVIQRFPEFEVLLEKSTSQDYALAGEANLEEGTYEVLITQNTRVGNNVQYQQLAKATLRIVAPRPSHEDPESEKPTAINDTNDKPALLHVRLRNNYIEIAGQKRPARVELFTLSGTLIRHATLIPGQTLHCPELLKGIYLIKVDGEARKILAE